MTSIQIGLAVLCGLAVLGVVVSFRRRDTQTAIGQLSNETVKADSKGVSTSAVALSEDGTDGSAVAATGSEVEKAARLERSGQVIPADDNRPPVVYVPPDPETLGVTRRQFLNRGIIGAFSIALGAFGLAVLAQLWPKPTRGFGGVLTIGKVEDIKKDILANGGFFYFPEGRMWLTEFPDTALAKADNAYGFIDEVRPGLEAGVVALYQTCPHLGCKVPECKTSQWFECPCHGSQYNRVGEKKGGPAPRGMDRFPMQVSSAGDLIVDTGKIIQGPPIGTNTTGQEAEGPNCLSSGGGH